MSEKTEYLIILGNLEAIDQGLRLLQVLNDEQYVHVPLPYVSSSIAQHFRHVVDMFRAISESAQDRRVIDYDIRRRGSEIESSRAAAKAELLGIRSWMSSTLTAHKSGILAFSEEIKIRTEVSTEETHSVCISSNVLRELVFASSHAIHHYALISVVAKLQGIELETGLGLAPATATFLRSEASGKLDLDQASCVR